MRLDRNNSEAVRDFEDWVRSELTNSDKELADELDAQDRLRNRGYEQRACPTCKGIGQIKVGDSFTECYSCRGRGSHWYAPITK